MYFYRLTGYEENTVIQNEKKYSDKKFKEMCKEAPLGGTGSMKYYCSDKIVKYLKKKYGFQELKTVAGFFVDGDIEDDIEDDIERNN